MPTNNSNPGNFANRPKEEVKAIASKGGKAGSEHKGFASQKYDDQKHVSHILCILAASSLAVRYLTPQAGPYHTLISSPHVHHTYLLSAVPDRTGKD